MVAKWRSTPRRWGSIHGATDFVWCSSRRATAAPTWSRSPQDLKQAPNLVSLLSDPNRTKIFHYARFDIAVLKHRFGVVTGPVWCTKIASKLARTYTDRHGLKDLARELINVDMNKQQQSSDWGADKITDAQMEYAASDVLYLHDIKRHLDRMLRREGRLELAETCFRFLPTRIELDLLGWDEEDIFAHS